MTDFSIGQRSRNRLNLIDNGLRECEDLPSSFTDVIVLTRSNHTTSIIVVHANSAVSDHDDGCLQVRIDPPISNQRNNLSVSRWHIELLTFERKSCPTKRVVDLR